MAYNPSSPASIRPQKWSNLRVIYFDGIVALITGNYDGDPEPCVGMRWMVAEGPKGYPVTNGHPTWMVLPCKIAGYVLKGVSSDPAPTGPDAIYDAAGIAEAVDFNNRSQ